MRWFKFIIGLVAALVLHALLDRFAPRWLAIVDPYLVLVVYTATAGNLLASIIAGVATGFVQDALSGSILGVHAFALTATGYLVAWVNSRLVIKGTIAFGACVVAATLANETIIALLLVLLVKQDFGLLFHGIVWKTVGTALLGMGVWNTLGGIKHDEPDRVGSGHWEERP